MTDCILKQAGVPGNVRILTAPGHEIAVWGMADGSDPKGPTTLGSDASVVDGWLGEALSPGETQGNPYMKDGTPGNERAIIDSTNSFDPEASPWKVTGSGGQPGGEQIVSCPRDTRRGRLHPGAGGAPCFNRDLRRRSEPGSRPLASHPAGSPGVSGRRRGGGGAGDRPTRRSPVPDSGGRAYRPASASCAPRGRAAPQGRPWFHGGGQPWPSNQGPP